MFICDSVDVYGPHVSVLTVHSPFILFEAGSFVGCCLMMRVLTLELQETLLCQPPASGWNTGVLDGPNHTWDGQNPGNPNLCYQACSKSTLSTAPSPQPQAVDS